MNTPEKLDLVLFWDDNAEVWLGSFLKYFIVAQGKTWQEALGEAKLAIVQQAELDVAHQQTPLAGCPPTPQDIVDFFSDPTAVPLSAEEVTAVTIEWKSPFTERYLGDLTVKRLDP